MLALKYPKWENIIIFIEETCVVWDLGIHNYETFKQHNTTVLYETLCILCPENF